MPIIIRETTNSLITNQEEVITNLEAVITNLEAVVTNPEVVVTNQEVAISNLEEAVTNPIRAEEDMETTGVLTAPGVLVPQAEVVEEVMTAFKVNLVQGITLKVTIAETLREIIIMTADGTVEGVIARKIINNRKGLKFMILFKPIKPPTLINTYKRSNKTSNTMRETIEGTTGTKEEVVVDQTIREAAVEEEGEVIDRVKT